MKSNTMNVKFTALDEISSAFEKMSNAGSKVLDMFDKIENSANAAFAGMDTMADRISEKLNNMSNVTEESADAINNFSDSTSFASEKVEIFSSIGEKTEEALQSESAALDKVTNDMDEFGKKTEETAKESEKFAEKSKDAIIKLQDVIVGAGIAAGLKKIVSGFAECSEAASDFQTNIAMVSTVADTNALSAERLGTQISKLSQDTGKSVNEIAEATYNAISAGVDTADAVNTVGEATKLATAGFTSSASALSVLTTAMNAYQLDASEITNISDSLVTSQNLGVLTIDQMASSMGKAISTASAYSVDLYNLESSYISLTKAGISVEESTTYVASMMNELGDAGSDVSKILQEETSMSFGQLMNSGYSLSDVLGVLYNSVEQDSEAFMNLWGSAEAGKAGNAIINQGLETFNTNLEKLANSAGTTQRAYETMTSTSEYSTQKLENSMSNLSIAVGNKLNPSFSKLKGSVSDVVDKFTSLIDKYPSITAVLTGGVVGIGSVTLAITGYTAATKIATVANGLFGASITAAIGPIALVTTGITAVTAAVVYFTQKMEEENNMTEHLTASSKNMQEELDALNEKYDAICKTYGKNSDEAYALKMKIDELSNSFENSKEVIGQMQVELESLSSSIADTYITFDEAITSNGQLEYSSMSLISQLETLATKSTHTDAELQIMESIVDSLNGSYEGLNLTLDETNGKLNLSVGELYKAVKQAADEADKQAATDALIQAMQDYDVAKQSYQDAVSESSVAWQNYEEMEAQWIEDHPIKAQIAAGAEMNWDSNLGVAFKEWEAQKEVASGFNEELDTVIENIREYCEALGYTDEETEDFINQLNNASISAEELANQEEELVSSQEAALEAISGASEQLETMAQAYDDAYAAAQESIEGQYALWDSVSEVVSMTADEISGALQSQIDYWNAYNENMSSLMDRANDIEGLKDMLTELADGSEDSAAMLAGMESMNDADLSAVVQQYNNLQTAQGDTATSIADLETNFTDSLANIQTQMETAVSNMNMSDEAKTNAKSTMDAYVSEIEDGVARAQRAIDSLSFANNKLSNGDFHGYAVGTKSAEAGLALVGENGPELVNFGGGETVYTADETADILADEPRSELFVAPTSDSDGDGETASSNKNITLKIEGGGELKVGGGVSKEDVLELMIDNIKDTLMGIIQQEIMEEGDLAYEF